MQYFDDILNVSALLRSRMKENADHTQELLHSYNQMQADYEEMHDQADALLDAVREIAAQEGIDLSAITQKYADPPAQPAYRDFGDLLISLPPDFDFAAEYARLVEEAHQAGFTNVHPEELLTPEERAHADQIREALDQRFEQETRLTKKDMPLLAFAVILRCLCYCILLAPRKKDTPPPPPPVDPAAGQQTGGSTANYTVDAAAGVDMNKILKSSGANTSGAASFGSDLLRTVSLGGSKSAHIRDELQILHEQVPFDLPDNSHFKHSDIAGFHPQLGWLIGVVNLLTNTVTTYRLDSFSVVPAMTVGSPMAIGQELSTPLHVLLPVIQHCTSHRNALIAAVVREADVLKVSKAPMEDVAAIMENTFYFERQNQNALDNITYATDAFSVDLFRLIGDTSLTAFLDLLISAIHAVHYDPETDGDKRRYAIRTNRILLLSQVLSTAANSTKALITQNPADIDLGGILMSFLKLLNSTSFWIDVKTDYLVSEYKAKIDEENRRLDKYFQS